MRCLLNFRDRVGLGNPQTKLLDRIWEVVLWLFARPTLLLPYGLKGGQWGNL